MFLTYLNNRHLSLTDLNQIIVGDKKIDLLNRELFFNEKDFCFKLFEAINDDYLFAVFGDYDVDGVASQTVAVTCLAKLIQNNNLTCFPADRRNGYGFNEQDVINAINFCRVRQGRKLCIVLTDNGVATNNAYRILDQLAVKYGLEIKVLVIDHHYYNQYDVYLPNNFDLTIIDANCYTQTTYQTFSATLATYFVFMRIFQMGINQEYTLSQNEEDWLTFLAGLSIISDVQNILSENRYYVKEALRLLKTSKYWKFRTLLKYFNATDFDVLGWQIAPMINSVSRINGSAQKALVFMLTDSQKVFEQKLTEMLSENENRKKIVSELLKSQKIESQIKEQLNDNSIIVALQNKDVKAMGLAGLIANRINSEYHLPTIVYTYTDNGLYFKASGSARVSGSNMFDIAKETSNYFGRIRLGGHKGAFGFNAASKEQLQKFIKIIKDADIKSKAKKHFYDFDYSFSDRDNQIKNIKKINEVCEPFGNGLSKPVLKISLGRNDYRVETFSNDDSHLKIILFNGQEILWFNGNKEKINCDRINLYTNVSNKGELILSNVEVIN